MKLGSRLDHLTSDNIIPVTTAVMCWSTGRYIKIYHSNKIISLSTYTQFQTDINQSIVYRSPVRVQVWTNCDSGYDVEMLCVCVCVADAAIVIITLLASLNSCANPWIFLAFSGLDTLEECCRFVTSTSTGGVPGGRGASVPITGGQGGEDIALKTRQSAAPITNGSRASYAFPVTSHADDDTVIVDRPWYNVWPWDGSNVDISLADLNITQELILCLTYFILSTFNICHFCIEVRIPKTECLTFK